jgi:hypothetical protein
MDIVELPFKEVVPICCAHISVMLGIISLEKSVQFNGKILTLML